MPSNTLLVRLQHSAHRAISKLHYGVSNFRHPLRAGLWETCTHTRSKIHTATTPLECSEIFQWAKSLEKIPGDMAEVGAYLGGTAALMLHASGKHLHLFDTFDGLPTSENQFEKGEWRGGLDAVKRNLAEWSNRVSYHVGLFPASADGLSAEFSFVHLDMDLYEGTLAALDWFWPRLALGGAILSHDYPYSAGVVRAFEEFFAARPEPYIPLSGGQCIAIKHQPTSPSA